MSIPGLRALRMRRACERWMETNDARGCALETLVEAATGHAEALARDLAPAEVAGGCAAVVAAHVASEEQRLAAEAIAGAREEERLRYLARRQHDYRQGLAGAGVVPPRGQRA